MANVFSLNNPYIATNNTIECIWRLTRVMKKAGWLTVACNNTVAKVAPANNGTDNWGSNADPLTDVYPVSFGSATALPWIVMQGPNTLKIPITIAPIGVPLRGEKITQGAGVEGELLGYVFDPVSSSGWMVVAPRTGTFSTSGSAGVITCAISGATFQPTGVIVTYIREVMFAKTNSASDYSAGQIFYICADSVTEGGQLYSSLATTAGATTLVAPGCAATGTNAFPSLGIVVRGTAGTMTTSNNYFISGNSAGYIGNYHTVCANSTAGANVSADGSFYIAGSNSTAGSNAVGFIYTKVDDTDPGDCDPYIFSQIQSSSLANWVRTNATSFGTNPSSLASQSMLYNTGGAFIGYQARGCPVTARDVACPYTGLQNFSSAYGAGSVLANYPQTLRTLNHPAANPPLTRENMLIYNSGSTTTVATIKHYKGRARWISIFSQGSWLDTFDNKKFICSSSVTASFPGIAIGPWDGSTTPIA